MSDSPPDRASRRYDVIVVLGARVEADGRPSPALARRARRGVGLFHQGLAPRLLLSGGADGTRPTEAEVMRALALGAGVPESRLLLERESRSTWDNAAFTRDLMAAQGLSSALLVTDRLHLPRALLCFRRKGLRVTGCAAERHLFESGAGRLVGQALYEAAALLRYLPRLLTTPRVTKPRS